MHFIILLILSIVPAAAIHSDTTSLDLFEKTWPRTNSFCNIKDKRVEILVRGGNNVTEVKEKGYGEFVFFKINDKAELFDFSKSHTGLYRLYERTDGSLCTTSQGFMIDKHKFAILLAEESRPHGDKLLIQFFDLKSMKPLKTIETNLLVDKAFPRSGGFIFKAMEERNEMEMGSVAIGKDKYTYQDRVFPLWMKYSSTGMEIDSSKTFAKLPWRKYFKNEAEFLKASGWDRVKKKFMNKVVYYAVTRPQTRRCLALLPQKKKLDGSETWFCQ
jgi:hypothetical protein